MGQTRAAFRASECFSYMSSDAIVYVNPRHGIVQGRDVSDDGLLIRVWDVNVCGDKEKYGIITAT